MNENNISNLSTSSFTCKSDFASKIYSNVEFSDKIKICMQCGMCGATCPLKNKMPHSPRSIWNLIRIGNKEDVLNSQSIMLCTSCYTCVIRCPRDIPVVNIMHGLANYALNNGYIPRNDTANFGKVFWNSIYNTGRVDETEVSILYSIAEGIIPGIRKIFAMKDIGLSLAKTKRMKLKFFIPPSFFIPSSNKIDGIDGLQKILDKTAITEKR